MAFKIPQPVLRRLESAGISVPDRADGDIRPWGGYLHLRVDNDEDEKILWVNPGGDYPHGINALSLQLHGIGNSAGHHEYWEALTPITMLISDCVVPAEHRISRPELLRYAEQSLLVLHMAESQSIHIEAGTMHALMNATVDHVVVRERRHSVADGAGAAHREDDIVRVLDHSRRDGTPAYADIAWEWILRQTRLTHSEFVRSGSILLRTKLDRSLSEEQSSSSQDNPGDSSGNNTSGFKRKNPKEDPGEKQTGRSKDDTGYRTEQDQKRDLQHQGKTDRLNKYSY
ncbi:MAG: hypothetical protein TR69_WS6001000377 [candidate division WS6 bacterium OLB20]|uniref:Uncharacterized protein n=1 Tax=candidate division WS6 bacterium OLB20 TaxID=1617426 RepID=A0A136LXI4_9BACT|nr:MAG: hypothetical protein TR69_WS6001000377 [candidate division WS6 bacterium OLB20]